MLQLAIITSALFYLSSGYHPIVDQLQNYVESNQTFASLINKTFDEAGTPNATYTDMYEFFDYWVVKAPNVSHSNFSELLSQYGVDTETGSEIFSSRKAQEWFQAYMNQVKEFCDSPNSTNVVPYWEARSDINMTEYIIPNGGYSSFNAFFSREIQPQYRPIDSPDNDTIITSPCDGQIVEIDTDLQMNKNYTIKGMGYSLSTMLRNDYYAEQFVGGTIIQIFLRTNNYHRYHSAVGGYAAQVDQVGGYQYWMPEQERQDKNLYYKWLVNNCRRGLLYVDTGKFGLVAHNYVGVWLVNSVNINVDAGVAIKKGDETGYFLYGGSTITVLFQKNALKDITVNVGDVIQMGERMAIANMDFYNEENKQEL